MMYRKFKVFVKRNLSICFLFVALLSFGLGLTYSTIDTIEILNNLDLLPYYILTRTSQL